MPAKTSVGSGGIDYTSLTTGYSIANKLLLSLSKFLND